MTPYNLLFNSQVKPLEESRQWVASANLVYQEWKEKPMDLNSLLCTGTQAWYGILQVIYDREDPKNESVSELCEEDGLYDILTETLRWGLEKFPENAVFNAYFGYMIQVMPYFFADMKGDYDGFRNKGIDMMRYAYELEPENPFARAMSCKQDYRGSDSPYYDACKAIWNSFTPEQWGDTAVQRYFFRILCGDCVYPDAYEDK